MNLSPSLQLPQKLTPQSDGLDLMACFDLDKPDQVTPHWHSKITIYDGYNRYNPETVCEGSTLVLYPFCRALIPTGLKLGLPIGTKFHITARSGLSTKKGIIVTNAPGKIDQDYTGMIYMSITNISYIPFEIKHGDRIAQGSLEISTDFIWIPVTELADTVRGEGGIGHTGV